MLGDQGYASKLETFGKPVMQARFQTTTSLLIGEALTSPIRLHISVEDQCIPSAEHGLNICKCQVRMRREYYARSGTLHCAISSWQQILHQWQGQETCFTCKSHDSLIPEVWTLENCDTKNIFLLLIVECPCV